MEKVLLNKNLASIFPISYDDIMNMCLLSKSFYHVYKPLLKPLESQVNKFTLARCMMEATKDMDWKMIRFLIKRGYTVPIVLCSNWSLLQESKDKHRVHEVFLIIWKGLLKPFFPEERKMILQCACIFDRIDLFIKYNGNEDYVDIAYSNGSWKIIDYLKTTAMPIFSVKNLHLVNAHKFEEIIDELVKRNKSVLSISYFDILRGSILHGNKKYFFICIMEEGVLMIDYIYSENEEILMYLLTRKSVMSKPKLWYAICLNGNKKLINKLLQFI